MRPLFLFKYFTEKDGWVVFFVKRVLKWKFYKYYFPEKVVLNIKTMIFCTF